MEHDIANNGAETIEETAAADTLKPGGGSGGFESKSVALSTFNQLLAQLGKEDLTDLFDQVQSQYGPNKIPGQVDNSGANRASLAPNSRPVKESVEEIFDGEELSESFKEKAEVVFEAVLNSRWILEKAALDEEFEANVAALEESFDEQLQEQANEIFDNLAEQLNQYMEYAVTEWIAENQLAIDNGLRADITEGFISGLQNLFAEHYIRVPEEELDVMAEMKDRMAALEADLNEAINDNINLKSIVSESVRASIVNEAAEGLTIVEADKLCELAEGIEFIDADSFARKVDIIKENYFSSNKSKDSGLLKEDYTSSDEATPIISESVSKYDSFISKTTLK